MRSSISSAGVLFKMDWKTHTHTTQHQSPCPTQCFTNTVVTHTHTHTHTTQHQSPCPTHCFTYTVVTCIHTHTHTHNKASIYMSHAMLHIQSSNTCLLQRQIQGRKEENVDMALLGRCLQLPTPFPPTPPTPTYTCACTLLCACLHVCVCMHASVCVCVYA